MAQRLNPNTQCEQNANGQVAEVMLATEALAAERESKTVGEISGLLATMEWHSSTIKG